MRRVIVFAGINAIERGAYNLFESHLLCLDDPRDRETLESVMAEERFHLSYVEHELERQRQGELGPIVTTALEQAEMRFKEFRQARQDATRKMVEKLLGGGA
jgi:hypothetical protein